MSWHLSCFRPRSRSQIMCLRHRDHWGSYCHFFYHFLFLTNCYNGKLIKTFLQVFFYCLDKLILQLSFTSFIQLLIRLTQHPNSYYNHTSLKHQIFCTAYNLQALQMIFIVLPPRLFVPVVIGRVEFCQRSKSGKETAWVNLAQDLCSMFGFLHTKSHDSLLSPSLHNV